MNPVKVLSDYRMTLAHSYDGPQDTTYRTPVEELEKRYAPLIKKLRKSKKQIIRLTKRRGGKTRSVRIVLSAEVRRKLNRLLPKIKQLGTFTATDFAKIASVQTVAANKYLDILRSQKLIVSDNKAWAASYSWNHKSSKKFL